MNVFFCHTFEALKKIRERATTGFSPSFFVSKVRGLSFPGDELEVINAAPLGGGGAATHIWEPMT